MHRGRPVQLPGDAPPEEDYRPKRMPRNWKCHCCAADSARLDRRDSILIRVKTFFNIPASGRRLSAPHH